jgi:hypothetical protein
VDGRKVDLEDKADCERRIRAEVNDMEHCMREHIRRIADVRLSSLRAVSVAMARTYTASQSYVLALKLKRCHSLKGGCGAVMQRTYAECKAPATTNKSMLRRAFERMDVTRTGDVTVQEFADVWNDAVSPDASFT